MTANAPLQARPGQVLLNRFHLAHPLGQGGMGEVWQARDQDLDLDIAIKLLHPELAASPAQVEFLKNECRLARSLNHPHIVQVFDFHHEGETVFISMAWVDGPSFDRWRRQAERPWPDRLAPLAPIARALDHVHGQNLVHRDIKSGNILIDRTGRPHLTDFGIAGVYQVHADRTRRHSGGSVDVMSPQQRQGLPPHPADDVYSFGLLLVETLAPGDRLPVPSPTDEDVRRRLAQNAGLSTDLIDITARMLAHRREERPASMASVAAVMEQALVGPSGQTIPPGETPAAPVDTPVKPSGDMITPQPFATPEAREPAEEQTRSWRAPVFIVLAALLLVAGGLGILQYLARHPLVPEPAPTTQSAPAPAPQATTAAPPPAPQTAADEDRAEAALADWRRARSDLEANGGPDWAPEEVAAVDRVAKAGDEAFLASDFTGAAQHYAAAAREARDLASRAPDVLARLLKEAEDALARGDGRLAGERFALALKIDPRNPAALKGQNRAQKVAEVVALMQNGEAHETAGSLALALADYEAAFALDPDWAPAREAVPRVRRQMAVDQFGRHMSAGLAAFHRKTYAEARREINKALAFKPGAPEALDALSQIDAAARDDRVARLRRQAQGAETDENWHQALQHYRAALAIDTALQFAVRGAARAEERLRLEKRVAYYVDHPGDLAKATYLEQAIQLMAELRRLTPQGPRLQSQIATLDRMVQNARQMVTVNLNSDEQTEVTIYRIGRLGRFLTETVELRPGTYTVTGSRDGYKDVRQTIRIRPGQGPVQVVIQCTEKI